MMMNNQSVAPPPMGGGMGSMGMGPNMVGMRTNSITSSNFNMVQQNNNNNNNNNNKIRVVPEPPLKVAVPPMGKSLVPVPPLIPVPPMAKIPASSKSGGGKKNDKRVSKKKMKSTLQNQKNATANNYEMTQPPLVHAKPELHTGPPKKKDENNRK